MKSFMLAVVVASSCCVVAEAEAGRFFFRNRSRTVARTPATCKDGQCALPSRTVAVKVERSTPLGSVTKEVVRTRGSKHSIALASAKYRAARGIHGHCYIDVQAGTSGVGWASNDSQPNTCLGRGGSNYAVVRGADGWYATKIR